VPKLSVEIWASALVLELTPETETIEPTSTMKLVTEDAQVEILIFFNAEDMVDQTTETRALKLMSDALENHTRDQLSESQAKNLLCLEVILVGSGEKQEMENGDH
jgi:hypothetical protein